MLAQTDWDKLLTTAKQAINNSYSPYSNYPVGAAALVDDGRIIKGCNIENASYGLTMCAESSLIADLINNGGGKIIAFVCINKSFELISPCGRCRQLLAEHSHKDMQILIRENTIISIQQLLPYAFDSKDLNH